MGRVLLFFFAGGGGGGGRALTFLLWFFFLFSSFSLFLFFSFSRYLFISSSSDGTDGLMKRRITENLLAMIGAGGVPGATNYGDILGQGERWEREAKQKTANVLKLHHLPVPGGICSEDRCPSCPNDLQSCFTCIATCFDRAPSVLTQSMRTLLYSYSLRSGFSLATGVFDEFGGGVDEEKEGSNADSGLRRRVAAWLVGGDGDNKIISKLPVSFYQQSGGDIGELRGISTVLNVDDRGGTNSINRLLSLKWKSFVAVLFLFTGWWCYKEVRQRNEPQLLPKTK
jgi:hypothetical protein